MAVWNGVPLQKAVLVRHEERGALASGGPKGVSDALDYIGREGRYESKSGIDRGATAADSRLVDGMSEEARRALDYIGREGDFAHKGEGRQVDATYWGQDGPMSREEAARGMTGAGAYMQSIVTVDRRYASELGYTSKQDFQRLIRSTWAEQARAWTKLDRPTERMFEHPEDIRWVASYHTDADQSLHVHVYTWGRAGDMRPGDRVSKTSTREGKEIVYREAYAKVRAARNERHTYLRDISRLNMARQLGQDVDQARVDALHAKAEARGWPERVADGPDWDASRHRGVERQIFKLREGLERGHGRLSRNFDAGAVARDLIREIENASPSAKAIKEAIRETDEQKADLYGYGSERQLGRGKMLRREREDYLSRLVPTVEKACLGTKRPEQLELEAGPSDGSGAARNLRSEARRDASAGPSQDDEAQKPGSRGGARKPSAPSAGISASRRAGEPPWEAAKRELKAKGQWVEPEAYKARKAAEFAEAARRADERAAQRAEDRVSARVGIPKDKARSLGRELYGIARGMRDRKVECGYDEAPADIRARVDAYARRHSEEKGYRCTDKWRREVYRRAQRWGGEMPERRELTSEERESFAAEFRGIARDMRDQGAPRDFDQAPRELRDRVEDHARRRSEARGYRYTESWGRTVYERAYQRAESMTDREVDARHEPAVRVEGMRMLGALAQAAEAIESAGACRHRGGLRPQRRQRRRAHEQEMQVSR